MKKFIYIAFALSALSSCDNREEFFNNQNESPTLKITDGTNETSELTDSVKISLKSSRKSIEVRLLASDADDNIRSITYNWITGGGRINYSEGAEISGNSINIESQIDLMISPIELGENILEFTVIDEFDKSSVVRLNLTTLINLGPVGLFSIKSLEVVDDLEYEIDASDSFDKDGRLGGGISVYEYTIEGNTFNSESNVIKYVFSKNGNTEIKLRVKDSDGEWSNINTEVFNIN